MDLVTPAEPNAESCGIVDHRAVLGLEALKVQIMNDIERKLSHKDEALWRRGQAEIRKLKMEQEKTAVYVTKLLEGQAALESENQKIRAAVFEITTKFELVVKEMRHVLSVLPQLHADADGEQNSPSPSVASTSAPDLSYRTTMAQTPVPMWHSRGAGFDTECTSGLLLTELPSLETEELRSVGEDENFSTPPRFVTPVCEVTRPCNAVVTPPMPWQGSTTKLAASASPAVLSLAAALPSAAAVFSAAAPHPSPGAKCLNLAEHLSQQATDAASSTTPEVKAAVPNPPSSWDQATVAPAGQEAKAVASPLELVNVQLVKKAGFVTLGVEVNQVTDSVDGTVLVIEGIDEHGLVGQHNSQQDSEAFKVHVGDRIIEVNGVRDDPNLILQECRESQSLLFVLARASGVAAEALMAVLSDRTYERQFNSGAGSSTKAAVSASTDEDNCSTTKVNSPLATRMRPEAQVFIPSVKKEAPTPSTVASTLASTSCAPPGLEMLQVSGLKAVCELSPTEEAESPQQEVNRALFH